MENGTTLKKSHIWTTGFAMFSMFFGAGNVVFPLGIGQLAQSQNIYAILGLLITAIGVPFIGLIAMTLYDGDYKRFFGRMGTTPGFLIGLATMGLIGPFGALPRCIALSFSTTKLFLPTLSAEWFSLISCIIIFLFTIRRSSIVDLLGYILTPLLLLSLGIIIIKGLLFSSPPLPSSNDPLATFWMGLKEGYQTMDLLGAFFFSSIVIVCLKKDQSASEDYRSIIKHTLKASCIAATLLALIYIGFSYVASRNSEVLAAVPTDQYLGTLALSFLGSWGGLVASAAVALACLTTAIALAAVSAEYIHKDLTWGKVPYSISLIITLVISYFVSILNFTGIVKMLAPILELCYPALIVLAFMNILYKLYRVESVKVPVFAAFALSLGGYLANFWSL